MEEENKSKEKVTCVGSEDRNIFEKIVNYFVGEVCVNPTKSNNETKFTDLVEDIGEGLTESMNKTINVIKEKVANGTDKISGGVKFQLEFL